MEEGNRIYQWKLSSISMVRSYKINYVDYKIQLLLFIFKPGVLQYEAVIDLPQEFFETERRKRQNQDQSQQIANLISQVSNQNFTQYNNFLSTNNYCNHRLMTTSLVVF